MKNIIVLTLTVGVLVGELSPASATYFTSSSPVPETKKAYTIFPADGFEIVDTGGQAIGNMLRTHGYEISYSRPPWGGVVSLDDFKYYISLWHPSVFVANGHAGLVGIAVEFYETEAARNEQYEYYRMHGYDTSQIRKATEEKENWQPGDPSPQYAYVISVTPKAIQDWAHLEKGAIAWVLTCQSASRATDGLTLPDAFLAKNAAWFLGTDLDYWFADMQWISMGFWSSVAGLGQPWKQAADQDKHNFTVWNAFGEVQQLSSRVPGRPNFGSLGLRGAMADTSCETERLYNPPRIVSAKLTQSDIYDWTYADQTYPFNEGDYPGDRSSAAKNPAKSGPLGIHLQFSESMDPTWSGFKIQLAPQGGGETVDYTNGSWSRTVLDNDTWIGSLTIPESGGLDGQVNLVAKARDAFLDDSSSLNADGELDIDGDGATNGSDSSMSFRIGEYNRQAVVDYVKAWSFADSDDDGNVDHVNSPPYTWFYSPGFSTGTVANPFREYLTNNGNNTVEQRIGRESANLASAALQAGGVEMAPGDWPQYGNTYSAVSRLAAVLPQISSGTAVFKKDDPPPAILDLGDIIRWDNSLMTVVIATNPVRLAFSPTVGMPDWNTPGAPVDVLGFLFGRYEEAVAYHVVGGSITLLTDETPPDVEVLDLEGHVIEPGGATKAMQVTVRVTDSDSGIGDFEVARDTPIVDSMLGLFEGGWYIFKDHGLHGASHEYTLDLSTISETQVFVQAFDRSGNYRIQSFSLDRTPPAVDILGGTEMVSGFRGIWSSTGPSTAYRELGIWAIDDGAGVKRLTLTGPSGVVKESLYPAGTRGTLGEGALTNWPGIALKDGRYLLEAEDHAGNLTSVPFDVDGMWMELLVDPDQSRTQFTAPNQFANYFVLRATTSFGFDRVERLSQSLLVDEAQRVLETTQFGGALSGQLPLYHDDLIAGNPGLGASNHFFLSVLGRDIRGNAWFASLNGYLGGMPTNMYFKWDGSFGQDSSHVAFSTDNVNSPIGLKSGFDSGYYKTPVLDFSGERAPTAYGEPNSRMLPGATNAAGRVTDPFTLDVTTYYPVGAWSADCGTLYNGAVNKQAVRTVEAWLWTGDSPSTLTSRQLGKATMSYPHVWEPLPEQITMANSFIPMKRYNRLEVRLTNSHPGAMAACTKPSETIPDWCDEGVRLCPAGTALAAVFGSNFYYEQTPVEIVPVPIGQNQRFLLGVGAEIFFPDVINYGQLLFSVAGVKDNFWGWHEAPSGATYNLTMLSTAAGSMLPFWGGTPQLTFPYDASGLTAGQLGNIRLYRRQMMCESCAWERIPADVNPDNTVVAHVAPTGTFLLTVSDFTDPHFASLDGAEFVSNDPDVTMQPVDKADPSLSGVFRTMLMKGRTAPGAVLLLGPTGKTFSVPGVLSVPYDPAELAAAGVSEDSLQIYQFSADGRTEQMARQKVDKANRRIYCYVGQFSSYFGIFGATPPVIPPDVTPPVTSMSFEGPSSSDTAGAFSISTFTRVVLQALDPAPGDQIVSGVAATYYSTAAVFNSSDVVAYSAPFELSAGTHSIAYFSQDHAGNLEAPHVASITVLNADTTPPLTQIVFEGYSSTQPAGVVRITTYTQISFLTADPEVPDALTSGLDMTVYALGEDPPQDFTGAFTLPFGTHTVTYFSRDKALNLETPKTASLEVVDLNISTQPPSEPGSGYALSADVAGNLWAVVRFDSGYKLAKFGLGGAGLASVELPGVGGWGDWSVSFDASGNAYAIGSGINTATGGNTVAIYKAAASGDVLLSSASFMSAYGKNDFAIDSAGDIWITGAVQTSGPPDFSGPVEFSLALWKYSPAEGTLALTTTYVRGAGLDMGYGIRLDGQGNIWLAGYSINPGAAGPNIIDLGAWKYDWTGTSLARQPVFLPGYASDPMGQFTAKVAVSSEAVYVAGNHANAGGGYDLSFAKLDLQGNVVLEKLWSVDGGGNSFPWGMARDGSGNILVAGSTKDKLAVWKYGANGALISAQTIEGVDGAKDIAVKGSEVWLSVSNSSAPFRFTGGAALAGSEVFLSSQATAPSVVLSPTACPIGVPFTITGTGFGTYNGSNTRVKFGTVSAALSVWNNTTISGTVPGLSTGSYAVAVERQHPSSTTAVAAGLFDVTALELWSMSPSSGPIGVPFTIRGPSFGPYNGANTRILIGGATASLSLWNETTISGAVPGVLGAGAHSVRIERQSGSMVSASNAVEFLVTVPQVGSLTPSSGPIGAPFTITGTSFGPYNGVNTRVLIGGTTAPLSLWNDTTISGTIPGIGAGVMPVRVERSATGGLVSSNTSYFEVTLPSVASISPSSGPIGVVFTLTGASFGPYNGANTQVLIGTSTAALSLWNDTTIKGAVPGTLGPGPYTVVVRRKSSDGGLVETVPVSFQVAGLYLASISPSSGPIGAPFTITGTDFDSYGGANTRVLFNGTTAALSLWTDTQIKGTVPALDAGAYDVLVERQSGTGVARSNSATFTVGAPQAEGISPTSGPIGVPFTIAGTGFGPYNGANTRVLIGGTTAPLSLWNDTTISGTIPGISAGTKEVFVERVSGSGISRSNTFYFEVTMPQVASVSPSSGPIGMPFAIAGTGFGPYNGANTRVLIGGTTAPLSLWNDTTISGSIPGLIPGMKSIVVERLTSDGGSVQANGFSFEVLALEGLALSPSSGPIGVPFTITGRNFGPYNGSYTRVLLGATTAALSLWNDTTISGTIPGLAAGQYAVKVERATSDGGLAQAQLGNFQVTVPEIASLTPSSGPIGAPFTITGTSFGSYNGANTRVLIGGTTAALSLWNDSKIMGRVPNLAAGMHLLVLQRESGGTIIASAALDFIVVSPEALGVEPSSGPIGMPFTITGSGFGPYDGANTRVKIGGLNAPLSLWNDSVIKGAVPGGLATGSHGVNVERASPDGGLATSDAGTFQVLRPEINSVTPASAPIGDGFTIAGAGFGPYNGVNTRVLIGGTTAPLSLWNDATIKGKLPYMGAGTYAVVVERAGSDGGLARSNEGSIQVVRPVISTITPAVALQGTPFELTGTGFGQYAGAATRVLIGGATTSLSLWNDTAIRGLVPDSLPDALYAVVVQRDALGGTVTSEPVYFIVDPPGSIAAPAPPAWFSEAALVVSTETGGKVVAPSRASVDVPPAALDEEVMISVSKPKDADDESKREKAAKGLPITKAGDPVEFGPEGTKFNYLVTVELPFDQRMIPPGKTHDDIKLHYWNKDRGEWEPLETDVDPVKGRVRALTNHFSVYQAMVTGVLPEAVALSDFEMREVYAFPNPARKGESPTIRVQVGWANSVEVKIFDASGRKVHAAGFGYPSVMDDGNGKGDQYTYDYRWDAGGVGSGVYTYVVTAKRVGQSDITIIKKLAIIR